MTENDHTHDIDINIEGQDHMKHRQHSMTASPRRRQRLALPSVALAGVVSLVALAGCGGSSNTPAASSSTASAQVPAPAASSSSAASSPTAQATTSSHAKKSKGASRAAVHHAARSTHARTHAVTSSSTVKITRGNPVHKPARGTGGNSVNNENPTGKASFADSGSGATGSTNPCRLVSQSQASSFTGKSIGKPRLAPLGPTCVYQELGGKTEVTMALQLAAFAKLKPHIHDLSTVTIAGHTGYCGIYGTSIMYVPMAQDRLLSISAPCSVGTKFAAAALPKLVS